MANVLCEKMQLSRAKPGIPASVQYTKHLGLTISSDLTWNQHVENIVAKDGKRVYMLNQLKRGGIGQHELVTIYVSVYMFSNMHVPYGIPT